MKSEKVTDTRSPLDQRWYDDACGTALGLEFLGERWSLLILRELLFGGRRFSELRAGLPGISANVLTQRLARMENVGILFRRKLPPPASAQVYELTPWGYEAEIVVQELGRWAARSPLHDPSLPLSAASIMMSFRTMFDSARIRDAPYAIGFRFGSDSFVARVAETTLTVARTEPVDVAACVSLKPETLAALTYGGLPLAEAIRARMAVFEGDTHAFERFLSLFVLPPQA